SGGQARQVAGGHCADQVGDRQAWWAVCHLVFFTGQKGSDRRFYPLPSVWPLPPSKSTIDLNKIVQLHGRAGGSMHRTPTRHRSQGWELGGVFTVPQVSVLGSKYSSRALRDCRETNTTAA
ncbi:unnamed protein product, partial [Ectocarpus fasciculatus]